jgi:ParB-like chromosome segregation protein Spo0J
MMDEYTEGQGPEVKKDGEGLSDTAHGAGGATAADDGHTAQMSATEGAPAVESAAETDREDEAPREERPDGGDGHGSTEGPADGEQEEPGREEYRHVPVDKLRLHPTLGKDVPRMSDDEQKEFLGDVREAGGIMTPILVQEDGDGYLVLDGRHRLEAARVCGHDTIPARIVDWPADRQVEEIFRTSLLRRNLTDDQRAALAAAAWEVASRRAKQARASKGGKAGGRGRGKGEDSLRDTSSSKLSEAERPRGSTLDETAKEFRVSKRKVKAARKLRKDDPGLADEVRDGKKTLPAAKREAKAKAGESPAGAAPGAEPEDTAPAEEEAAAGKTKRVKIIINKGDMDAFVKALEGHTIKDPLDVELLGEPAKSLVEVHGEALAKALERAFGLMPAWVLGLVTWKALDLMFRGPEIKVDPPSRRRSEPQTISTRPRKSRKTTHKMDGVPEDDEADEQG